MKKLDLARVNHDAPYQITESDRAGFYDFVTDHDVEYSVCFEEDDLLLSGESYQFAIINANNKKAPRDAKVRDTIILLVEEFFRQNNTTLLYICETGDGRQSLRNRLFDHWFNHNKHHLDYFFLSTSITDDAGIINYAAILLRNDNPHLAEVVAEFTETIQLLKQKP